MCMSASAMVMVMMVKSKSELQDEDENINWCIIKNVVIHTCVPCLVLFHKVSIKSTIGHIVT